MENHQHRLSKFLRRLRPFRWPVRVGVLTALAVGALLPVWPKSYGMIGLEIAPETTLADSLHTLIAAAAQAPLGDASLFVCTLLLTVLLLAFIGGVSSAISVSIFLFVPTRSVRSQFLPDHEFGQGAGAGQALSYAAPMSRSRAYLWPILICVAIALGAASWMNIWETWFFSPWEGTGELKPLWMAIHQLPEAHRHLPGFLLLSLYVSLLRNVGVASFIGVGAGFIVAYIRTHSSPASE